MPRVILKNVIFRQPSRTTKAVADLDLGERVLLSSCGILC